MFNDLVNEKFANVARCYFNWIKPGRRVILEFRKVRYMGVEEDLVGEQILDGVPISLGADDDIWCVLRAI